MKYLLLVISFFFYLFIFTGCATSNQIKSKSINNPITYSETKTIYVGDIDAPEISDHNTYDLCIRSHGFGDVKIEKIFVPK